MYETGAMRRTHLRGRENILKRLLIHAAAFNIALLVRKLYGIGKPRTLQGGSQELLTALLSLWIALSERYEAENAELDALDGFAA
jgi:transposase